MGGEGVDGYILMLSSEMQKSKFLGWVGGWVGEGGVDGHILMLSPEMLKS